MIKKIIGTIITRILSAIITLLIVVLSSNAFGPAGMGNISLIILAITIVLLFSNFVGGSALIYLIPRKKLSSLFILSYCWALLMCALVSLAMWYFKLFPQEYLSEIAVLSILYAITSIHINIFIAKEQINKANLLSLMQVVFQAVFLLAYLQVYEAASIFPYLLSLFTSYGLCLIISFIMLIPTISFDKKEPISPLLKETLKYGSFVQFANIIQLLNYRLSYFLLNSFSGKTVLGNYSIGVQLSEGLWIVSKSVATVQYSKISNQDDPVYSKKLSLQLFKVSFVLTMIGIGLLLLIPGKAYTSIFGDGFLSVKPTILLLSPGIMAVACYSIFSHYFSGTGRHYHNTLGSLTGLIITATGGFILIPSYGLTGAAVTASISYMATLIYQFIVFQHIAKPSLKEYIPSGNDFKILKEIFFSKSEKQDQNEG